jgi:hypothetical protein
MFAAAPALWLACPAFFNLVVVGCAVASQHIDAVNVAWIVGIWSRDRVLDDLRWLIAAVDGAGMVVEGETLRSEAAPKCLAIEDRVRHQAG